MTFVAGVLLMTLFGAWTWRLEGVRQLDWPARIAIAFAAGMLAGGVFMFAYSMAGVPWKRWTLAIPLVVAIAFAINAWREAPRAAGGMPALLIFILLMTYGVATARVTNPDLFYFWGPKAQRFWMQEKIDVDFLRFPHYSAMHRDYPPLQPLVYAFGALVAHRFSWWGALFLTPLLLLATVLAFRGYSRNRWFALLLAAILAYGITEGRSAGGAEPLLYFYEVIALCALTFRNDYTVASSALAGVVLTKVEGAAFVAVVLVAFVVTRRKILPAIAMAIAPAALIGAWILFAQKHMELDSYARQEKGMHFEQLGTIVKGTLGAFYLPWIAAIAPLPFARNWKRAVLPLLVAAGTLASLMFYYLHEADPMLWIITSAERVLLTTVIALIVAGAAASSDENVC